MADLIVMNKLNDLLRSVSVSRNQEDFVDRLNFRVMTGLLLTAATAIFAKDYMGNPIQCWTSAEWPKSWIEYAHDICFVENTYYVPMNEVALPRDEAHRQKQQLGYYQWVPFLLVFLAMLFLTPNLIWQYFNASATGLPICAILSLINDARRSASGLSEKTRQNIAYHLFRSLKQKKRSSLTRYSACAIYFFIKCLYLMNILFQMWFLSVFLSGDTNKFGFSMMKTFAQGRMWHESGYFPRVTVCDFEVRSILSSGDIEKNSVQCVLMGNMINEKVFLLLFILLILLGIATVMNILLWARLLFLNYRKQRFIRRLFTPNVVDMIYPVNESESAISKIIIETCEREDIDVSEIRNEIYCILSTPSKKDENDDSQSESEDQETTCNKSTVTEHTTDTIVAAKTETSTYSKALHHILQRMKKKNRQKSFRKSLKELKHIFECSYNRMDLCFHIDNVVNNNESFGFYNLLNADGILLLELICCNSSDADASAILVQVFTMHLADEKKHNNTSGICEYY